MKKPFLIFFILLVIASSAFAQSSEDYLKEWTILDDANKPYAVVLIYKQSENTTYSGRVIKLYPKMERDSDCSNCPKTDERYNKPISGMQIITDLQWDDNNKKFINGKILDPREGVIQNIEIALDADPLKLNVKKSNADTPEMWYSRN